MDFITVYLTVLQTLACLFMFLSLKQLNSLKNLPSLNRRNITTLGFFIGTTLACIYPLVIEHFGEFSIFNIWAALIVCFAALKVAKFLSWEEFQIAQILALSTSSSLVLFYILAYLIPNIFIDYLNQI